MFELERRPKAQNIGNANGYLSGMFNFRWKVCRELKWRPFWKFWNIKHSFNLTSDMKRSSQIMPPKVGFFVVMTSSMTSQGGLKDSLYIYV